MDPENVGKETILKVTDWLRGVWEMRRRAGPVQRWIDSIPLSAAKSDVAIASECREYVPRKLSTPTEPQDIPLSREPKHLPSMTISAPVNVPSSSVMSTPVLPSSLPQQRLARDASFQSDSSHCSSVESLLELRKADPTAILLDLGFGGCSVSLQDNGPLSRIPKRFLQPSTLKGIAIDNFVKQQQETSESFDSVSLGYRGLTGSPYVAPSEIVQKIMERLREHENHELDTSSYNCYEYNPAHQNGKLSVLSLDNRQYLEQPRSKSPDMRNKRMIIGQKSFAFGCDGNLIEIPFGEAKLASIDTVDNPTATTLTIDGESVELKQSSPVNDIAFEHRYYFSKDDDTLTEQLSFHDSIEFPETDQLLKKDQLISTSNNSSIAQNDTNVDIVVNDKQKYDTTARYEKREYSLDIRRASDGLCDIKSSKKKIFDEGRRFSDSEMRTVKSRHDECILLKKRKSLQRQSRVCDTAMHYCGLSPVESNLSDAILEFNVNNERDVPNEVVSTHQLSAPKSFQSIESKSDVELEMNTKSQSEELKCTLSSLRIGESINDQMERFEDSEQDSASDHSCADDSQFCCYKSKVRKSCKHGTNCLDCCCHVDKRKYLKKMKKIMNENKKLEDMLARSRREVAEIRDMLSSVLSVRMEPGF